MSVGPCLHSMFGHDQVGHLHLGRQRVHGKTYEEMVLSSVLF